MANVTHEMHDRCITTINTLKTAHPDYAAMVAARVPMTIGSPEHSFWNDVSALNEVALSFATGDRVPAKTMKRALSVLSRVASVEG